MLSIARSSSESNNGTMMLSLGIYKTGVEVGPALVCKRVDLTSEIKRVLNMLLRWASRTWDVR